MIGEYIFKSPVDFHYQMIKPKADKSVGLGNSGGGMLVFKARVRFPELERGPIPRRPFQERARRSNELFRTSCSFLRYLPCTGSDVRWPLSVCLSRSLALFLSLYVSVYLSLSLCLSFFLLYLSVCLSLSLSVCLSVCLSIYVSKSLCLSCFLLCISLWLCLSLLQSLYLSKILTKNKKG